MPSLPSVLQTCGGYVILRLGGVAVLRSRLFLTVITWLVLVAYAQGGSTLTAAAVLTPEVLPSATTTGTDATSTPSPSPAITLMTNRTPIAGADTGPPPPGYGQCPESDAVPLLEVQPPRDVEPAPLLAGKLPEGVTPVPLLSVCPPRRSTETESSTLEVPTNHNP